MRTERKFYQPRGGVDGKWVDDPTSANEEANLDLKLQESVQNMELELVKPNEAGRVEKEEMAKNQPGEITDKDEKENMIIKNDHGMYVENLEYDSDETREMTEEELLEYGKEW